MGGGPFYVLLHKLPIDDMMIIVININNVNNSSIEYIENKSRGLIVC